MTSSLASTSTKAAVWILQVHFFLLRVFLLLMPVLFVLCSGLGRFWWSVVEKLRGLWRSSVLYYGMDYTAI